ncbi:hypothetical protein BFJ63_vAg15481 [Fusarium oxysporum f. sp. narcissi]|uniref:CFEM domain-containing protein n=3 Tax=Fusarium oxysporum TaxID=5507 RepID=A0A420MEP8_FUSOX|nr:hypothetical protein FOVG_17943 [Fusarium oxysporum f. sp. pisi HDV247]RKK66566.1 hypothetical protein BFJ69_g15282 [Fusarium oxysporum]RYC81621.1 hypothetical protein BFJ63_vAg15481 [Fusarium oxysporum f. sp. narcissi]
MKISLATTILVGIWAVQAVSNLPSCANGCLSSIAKDLHCSESDLKCLCDSPGYLAAKMSGCVLTAGCWFSDIGPATVWAPRACAALNGKVLGPTTTLLTNGGQSSDVPTSTLESQSGQPGATSGTSSVMATSSPTPNMASGYRKALGYVSVIGLLIGFH